MYCSNCRAKNPDQFTHCGECGLPLFLAVLKEIGETSVGCHYIFGNDATIGRHHDNTIVLRDDSLSRFHARIDHHDGRFFIQDLSSSNGVIVNDAKVRRSELKDFDRITLGRTFFLFRGTCGALRGTCGALRATGLPGSSRNRLGDTEEDFLAAIKDIGQGAQTAALSNQMLEIAAQYAIKLTRAERAIIFLYDQNLNLQPAVFYNLAPQELKHDEFEVSRSAIAEVENTGEMLIREQCLSAFQYQASQSIHSLQLDTIICLPLKSSHQPDFSTTHDLETRGRGVKGILYGVLYMDCRRPLKGLPQYRKSMLQVLADQTSLAIEHALLKKEVQEQKQLKQQVQAAKTIQQRLFPQQSFSHARLEMAYYYAAAQQIGGDYLTFLPLSDTRFLFAIGDVVGKGLPAGLVVMTIHGGLYSEITHQADLLTLTQNLDYLLYEYAQGKVFVTFFACVLDVEKMRLEYTSAGHNPPLLYCRSDGKWHKLHAAGIPLGLDPDTTRALETIPLQPGDLITLYTDGVTEATDPSKKQFGVEGLKKVLSAWLAAQSRETLTLTALLDAVIARLRHFTDYKPFVDDTTLMTVVIK
jgi:serine phosphatase RsbU (regulator of sigma subunit)